LLEYLFSNRTKMDEVTTLFVFIRPVILRDDKFADLKFLSEEDARQAGVPSDLPVSEPITIK
jgi:type II secretory pathway component GspD/PulD (secretin)